jgi:hypothetical protein
METHSVLVCLETEDFTEQWVKLVVLSLEDKEKSPTCTEVI